MEILPLRLHPELAAQAAEWFHQKWGVPAEDYRQSIDACLQGRDAVPQWYLARENGQIAGGVGVIENDFHDRKDLSPNVCALYVEEPFRGQGLAGRLLLMVCAEMAALGDDTLYLVTDHTFFYERYGWNYLCMVQGDDGLPTRMYTRRIQ